MSNLSASASIVLNYARSRANNDGYAEINDDIGLPEHIVVSACAELQSKRYISDCVHSEDSVESVTLVKSAK